MHVIFDETNDKSSRKEDIVDDDVGAQKMKKLTLNDAQTKEGDEKQGE